MSEKILIVDDEVEIADLIEVYLKNENYTVFKFYTATEALEQRKMRKRIKSLVLRLVQMIILQSHSALLKWSHG